NTAGAVTGTLVAAFVLLPALGLLGTLGAGAAVNVLVFAIASVLARGAAPVQAGERGSDSPRAVGFVRSCVTPLFEGGRSLAERCGTVFRHQSAWMLVLIMLSGANAFFYEVLWTRMLAHVLGSSVYAFAAMLAAFLAGIALGGGLAGPFARDRERAARGFALAHLGIAALSAAIYRTIPVLLPESLSAGAMAGVAISVLLPATIFIGATFPLAVRSIARDERDAGAATARIYAWNTVGAIAGAVTAGIVLIPSLGFEGAIKL